MRLSLACGAARRGPDFFGFAAVPVAAVPDVLSVADATGATGLQPSCSLIAVGGTMRSVVAGSALCDSAAALGAPTGA